MNPPIALITGASGDIGSAIATKFASEGYQLYLSGYRHESALISLCSKLEETFSVSCRHFIGDLASSDFVSELFSKLDSLDILVNNAGISHIGLLSDMSLHEWHQVLDTNLTSAFLTSKYAIPLMLKRHSGRIINISSVWGVSGASMEAAYSASKGGMNAMTRALAKELAPSNIQVNAIACGLIDTKMNRHLAKDELAAIVSEIPADRIGSPDEVADLAFQLSVSPSYLTGQVITLDGGWT